MVWPILMRPFPSLWPFWRSRIEAGPSSRGACGRTRRGPAWLASSRPGACSRAGKATWPWRGSSSSEAVAVCACAPRRGGAARRRVSSPVWPFSIYQPHGIYVVIPPPSNACISNRVLGRCALKADPTSVPTWHAWADLEERGGHLARAAELRSLGLQERTEAAGASLDLSPGELLRVDLPLMPVLAQLRAWLTRGKATGGGQGGGPGTRVGKARPDLEPRASQEAGGASRARA